MSIEEHIGVLEVIDAEDSDMRFEVLYHGGSGIAFGPLMEEGRGQAFADWIWRNYRSTFAWPASADPRNITWWYHHFLREVSLKPRREMP